VKEYLLARSLENHLSKKRILELYLNIVEMGERVYGAEAASRYYFKEPASALSPQQAALLAGCLPNPRVMVPGRPDKRLRRREGMILSRMRRWGYLAEKEVLTAPPPKATEQHAEPAPPANDTDLQPPSADTAATTETTDSTTTYDNASTAPPSQTESTATH
jgi:membrane peptidoglycan carboxypeptidase